MRARVLLLLGLLVAGEGLVRGGQMARGGRWRACEAVLGGRAHLRTARTQASPAPLRPPRTFLGRKGSLPGSRRAHAGCGSPASADRRTHPRLGHAPPLACCIRCHLCTGGPPHLKPSGHRLPLSLWCVFTPAPCLFTWLQERLRRAHPTRMDV